MERPASLGEEQELAYRALLELAFVLQDYRDEIVLVGGWSAYLLATHYAEDGFYHHHVGSKDVDLLLNIPALWPCDMREIRQMLMEQGYEEDPSHAPFRLVRRFDGEKQAKVLVDLMAPDTMWPRRPRPIERGVWVMTLDGGSLTTQYKLPVVLRGKLTTGRQIEATIHIIGFPAFFALKGITLGDRGKQAFKSAYDRGKYQKNAYDIACVIEACGPSRAASQVVGALAETKGHEHEELARGLSEIHLAFGSRDAGGPDAAAVVYAEGDPDLERRYARQVFEAVAAFLEASGRSVER